MKYVKIGFWIIWVALLLNFAANAWAGNYRLMWSETATLFWMLAWWFALRSYESLKPYVEREEAWHVYWHEARRWLAEFPDARDALDYVHNQVRGVRPFFIQQLRENMRARRGEEREEC